MKHNTTLTIILRRINYGEADRILTVLSSDYGKLSLLAKGSRRAKSKLAGGLELFSVSDIGFIDGRSELKTVTSTRLRHYYHAIAEDYQLTMIAYDCLKIIDTMTQHAADGDHFELLERTFEALANHDQQAPVVFAWFLSRLLVLSGINVNLENQVGGKDFSEGAQYQFSFEDRAFFEYAGGPYTPSHIKFLRLLEKVTKPAHLLQVRGAVDLSVDLKPMLQQCITLH